MSTDLQRKLKKQPGTNEVASQLLRLIEDLRFGSIEITVHDGKVVQIERREKIRTYEVHRTPGDNKN